jgi:hypothetical protein
MKTNPIRLLTAFSWLLFGAAAFGGQWLDLYWPLNDGDNKTFIYDRTNELSLVVHDYGGGEWQLCVDLPDVSECLNIQCDQTGCYLSSAESMGTTVSFDPPVLLLNDNILQNGGTVKTVTTATQFGLDPYPATYTVTVAKSGAVTVPAGTWLDCRSIKATEVATIPGYGTITASALTAYLGPRAGIIKMLIKQPSDYAALVSGSVGGVDLRCLANATAPQLAISFPQANQRISNAVTMVQGTAGKNVSVSGVRYQINTTPWQVAQTTNSWTNWFAMVDLLPGSNKFLVYALDACGNPSPTQKVSFSYVVSDVLTVGTNGPGTITPNYSGQLLEIGTTYRMTARAASGFAFTEWTGSLTTNSPTLTFVMQSNLNFTATFVDTTKPLLTITAPKSGLHQSNNPVLTVTGTAKDNKGVDSVFFDLNGAGWNLATTTNNWANWTAPNLTLIPGTNIFRVYALDMTGNGSLTSTGKYVSDLYAPLLVQTDGLGTVTPNYNAKWLRINGTYRMTARPGAGFAFRSWSGSVLTNNPTLIFGMTSNLTFTANFVDVARPVNIISYPVVNQRLTNAATTLAGKAKDNTGVGGVWYQIDGTGWNQAATTNGWTNWTAAVPALLSGANLAQSFAIDSSGNASLTNSIKFVYAVVPSVDWAPESLNGLTARVTSGAGSLASVSFDISTFSQTGTGTNLDDYGLGAYVYSKTGTNTGLLALTNTVPQLQTDDFSAGVQLFFTNHYAAAYTNENGDSGALIMTVATNLLPASLASRTIVASNSGSTNSTTLKFIDGLRFTKTPANNSATGSSSGTYTFSRFSPVSGLLVFSSTDLADAGSLTYVQVTFTSATKGRYLVTAYESSGTRSDMKSGAFTFR